MSAASDATRDGDATHRPRTRTFLLSPANCGGPRGRLLLRREAGSALALRLREEEEGVTIGEVFSFVSGLYFRGKLAYARAFQGEALVITPTRGLLPADTPVTHQTLREFARVDIGAGGPRYRRPLERDAAKLCERGADHDVVLLGSIATGKYVDVLSSVLGGRLLFPADFVGRGDMSRGGLMLRCARDGRELAYIPVHGAVRHGKRPPKLPKL